MNANAKKIIKSCGIAAAGAVAATLLDPNLDWGGTTQWVVAACTVGARIILLVIGMMGAKKASALLAFLALLLPIRGSAQNLASDWSFGPTATMTRIQLTDDGTENSILAAGLGVTVNRNFLRDATGSVARFTLGLPLFVQMPTSNPATFEVTAGVTFGTFNNLVAIGPALTLIEATDGFAPAGVFDGLQRRDISFLLSFSINLGGGQPASAGRKMGALLSGKSDSGPPPNYVRLW